MSAGKMLVIILIKVIFGTGDLLYVKTVKKEIYLKWQLTQITPRDGS